MANFQLGIHPPRVHHDVGSGPWAEARVPLLSDRWKAFKYALEVGMKFQFVELAVGADAVAHMQHYLNNSGKDLELDMAALAKRVPLLQHLFTEELTAAREFAHHLPPGVHHFTSPKVSNAEAMEGTPFYYAVGGFQYWGQGVVNVRTVLPIRPVRREYTMRFEFHFFDRYNWDLGKAIRLPWYKKITIPDTLLQGPHQHGIAKEFDMKGVLRMEDTWIKTRDPFENLRESPQTPPDWEPGKPAKIIG